MLSDLNIYNFALIEKIQVELGPDLNMITGETGAGKSIIIKALDMLLGARASNDYIRKGKEKAIIEAHFVIRNNYQVKEKLKELGMKFNFEEGLIISRELNRDGNNKSRINGRIVTLEMVGEVSQYLVDIHGQHEHQSLFETTQQLSLLDEFGGAEAKGLLSKVKKYYYQLKEKKEKLYALDQDERERVRKMDLLKFQLKEIEEADLATDEDYKLLAEKKKLASAEDLAKTTEEIYNQLYDGGFEKMSVLNQLEEFKKELSNLLTIDQQLESTVELLSDSIYKLEEVAYDLGDYQEDLEFNPQRLNQVEGRLKLINQLKRKYGNDVAEILAYQQKITEELNSLENSEVELQKLKNEIQKLEKEYLQVAEKLSALRKEIAQDFESKIMAELKDLSMEKNKFKISFKNNLNAEDNIDLNQISPRGIDKVQFLISTNPGEDLKSLAKIASGGEISRTMLALKKIIAEVDQVPALIFDEVDVGIGGQVAKLVAQKLLTIAQNKQVICITHLPQIASLGDRHYHISKNTKEDYVETEINYLEQEQRIIEISRMLGGSQDSKATIEHAKELIEVARREKEGI